MFEEEILDLTPLPFIVAVIDEVADLMLVAGKEIEAAVQRLAQMARAAGIHVIMATQRPSVDVITGTIKANFHQISFQVTSRIDSRTILGEQVPNSFRRGDMLFMEGGGRGHVFTAPSCRMTRFRRWPISCASRASRTTMKRSSPRKRRRTLPAGGTGDLRRQQPL